MHLMDSTSFRTMPNNSDDSGAAVETQEGTHDGTGTQVENNSTQESGNDNNDNDNNNSNSHQPSSPPEPSSPKAPEHPVHSPYNRRIQQKSSQYYEAFIQRTSMVNSTPSKTPRRNSVTITPRKLPSVEKKEQIESLNEQNESLSKEVKTLCRDKNSLVARVGQLEDDLHAIMAKTQDLVNENTELNAQVQGTKIEISARDSMLVSLSKDKCILESEKQYLLEDKSFLENQLLEMNKKLRETSKRADEAESAVASVVHQIDNLNRNLARMSKSDNPNSEVQEIVKQMELHSLQACKDVLKKELKKLTGTVLKAREEATEAKMIIENCRSDEAKFKADVARLEKALKSANEYSGRLEKQEKLLKSNVELFDARMKSLENELNFVRAERDNAIKGKIQKEAASGGMEAIKTSIHVLHENAKKAREEVLAMSIQMPELIQDKARSGEATKNLEMKARELAARSTTLATAAEEQLGKLKKEVDAIDAALEEAKDAAEDSETKAWQMIAELSSAAAPPSNNVSSSKMVDLPAATTYLLGLGLLAYSVYISNHS